MAEHRSLIDALPAGTDFSSFSSHKELARICHAAVNAAITIGIITRPTECSKCHNAKQVYQIIAHHPDYSKPLEIDWLCGVCHSAYHWDHGHRKYTPRKQQEPQELTYEPD